MKPIGTMQRVRRGLILRGWNSVDEWARAHGFLAGTVRRVVYDWGMRDREPLGGIGRQVMAALRAELDKPLPLTLDEAA
ncbi:MAG: hypothetical protein AB1735_04130 [Pseudomonadota bacterium]|jgi:hypothetical protein